MITGRQFQTVAAVALGMSASACTDERVGALAGPHLLAVSFDEQFWVGDGPAERPFARVVSMVFAPDGRLVVADRDALAILVLDRDGTVVLEWGGRGDGPGEFEEEPDHVAVSDGGNVAVSSFRRVDVFTPDGILIGVHLLDDMDSDMVAFDRDGYVVAEVTSGGRMLIDEASQDHLMRLRDRETLWSGRRIETGNGFAFFFPGTITAGLDAARVATAMNDRYEIDIRDSSTGRVLGRITRDITPREPPEEFKTSFRESMVGLAESIAFGETLPVLANVFLGPPDRTVWVRRGIGVSDELAPPVGNDIDTWELQLYDLFDGADYEYIGTVEAPEGLILMAGDSTRVAGVHTDELGVHSVRVLRVEINPRWRQ